jgi:hypothetical protein
MAQFNDASATDLLRDVENLIRFGEEPTECEVRAMQDNLRTAIKLLIEAPKFFHPGYDFDGEKLRWLKRAGLVEEV